MGKIAFPRTMRNTDPKKLSSALAENMRYLENTLNRVFNFDHDILSNIGVDDHHVKYTDAEVDTIVATHDAIADAHHAKYLDSEVDTIVATHAAVVAAHHTKYTDAEVQALIDSDHVWGDWSPTMANMTIGNGTVIARYIQVGKRVDFYWSFKFGSTSAMGTNPSVSLPVSPKDNSDELPLGPLMILDDGVIRFNGSVRMRALSIDICVLYVDRVNSSYSQTATITATVPITWTTNDVISFSGTYEAS